LVLTKPAEAQKFAALMSNFMGLQRIKWVGLLSIRSKI
jgi:hypothetical protein